MKHLSLEARQHRAINWIFRFSWGLPGIWLQANIAYQGGLVIMAGRVRDGIFEFQSWRFYDDAAA